MSSPKVNPDPPLAAEVKLPPLHQKWLADGIRLFRQAPLRFWGGDQRFFLHWNKHKAAWLGAGWSVKKVDNIWFAQQWLTADYRLTPVGLDLLKRFGAPAQGELGLKVESELGELPELPGGLEDKLFAYQRQPARQLYRAVTQGRAEWGYPGAVDLSDMGTGKTYQALAAALATGKKVIVLCPVVGRNGWLRAFQHFGAEPHALETYEAVRGNWRREIVELYRDGSWFWHNPNDIILILDEAQALRHDDTLNVQCCSAAIRQGIPIIIASATVAIDPREMRFAGRITGLHRGAADWDRFLAEHGCWQQGKSWTWDKDLRGLSKMHAKLFPRRGCRVRKEDLGDEVPETIIEILALDVPEAQQIQQEWQDVENLVSRLTAQGVDSRKIRMDVQIARMHLWQRCEDALVEPVAERARAELDEGRSIACFLNFNASRIRLGKLLGTSAGFYGGQNRKARAFYEAQFQADKIHVLISNMGAGGASVSLHDVRGERPRTAFIFPTDHVVPLTQATGRVDRAGGKSISRQFIPVVAGTISERMVRSTRRKMLGISSLNDGIAKSRI